MYAYFELLHKNYVKYAENEEIKIVGVDDMWLDCTIKRESSAYLCMNEVIRWNSLWEVGRRGEM